MLNPPKEFNIVFYKEPLVATFIIKGYIVTNLNRCCYQVGGFNIDNIRNNIILMPQIYSLHQMICSLGLTSAHFKNFKSLVIVQQNSTRASYNLTLAGLRYDIYRITGPNVNTNNTVILIIKSNSTWFSIRSTARNIRLSFQASKSIIHSRSSVSGIAILGNITTSQALLNSLLSKRKIIIQNIFITRIPQSTLTASKLTFYYNLSARIGQIHRRPVNSLNFTSKAIHNIAAFALRNSDSMMHHLTIIRNNGVLGARIVNHLIVASNKKFLANRMYNLIALLILIGIFSDYLCVNATNLRKLNSSKDISASRT